MTHPVVVAVSEGDEAREAVALGIVAARLLDGALVLAGVAVAAEPGALRDYVARELHRQADAVPDDLPCTIHVVTAPGVLPGLEVVVASERAQLLVIGASHLGPFARAVRGDIGLAAAHHAGCSVLAVPHVDGVDVAGPPRRVGVALDGSATTGGALALATALAERAGAELVVLADASAGAQVAASRDVDLLVIGTADVSPAVLGHAGCPVLTVPDGAWLPTAV